MKEFSVPHLSSSAAIISDDRHFLEALVRWNYFPNQKDSAAELPPNISTRRFTPEIALKLLDAVGVNGQRGKLGFDLVEYRATRYNNVSRVLGLIHPLALAKIFRVVKDNVESIREAIVDANSLISAERHVDGRIFIMNYEDPEKKTLDATVSSFGKKFRAHTDIANCFGSIYTHSLEWAGQGFAEAKANLGNQNAPIHWSGELDRALRFAKRKETSGLPIGPAISSIAVEIILAAVDRELRKSFSFVRYLDDYTAVCDSHYDAEEFIRVLGKELSKYKLSLNLMKTSIVPLPSPLQENWVYDLMNSLPPIIDANGKVNLLSTRDAFQFLEYAVRLNNETPDGSVLKFAVSSISRRLDGSVAADVFSYVLNLAWHYPVLLPYLEKIDARSIYYDKEELIDKLNQIIIVNALQRRSDGICWSLYYLEKLEAEPSKLAIEKIIDSADCVSLAMLSRFPVAIPRVLEYANSIMDEQYYTIDQNWLFFYQLYFLGLIKNPYKGEVTFAILKKYDVDFFCNPNEESKSEAYSWELFNPFTEEGAVKFDDWIKI
jgi:hypothetical protein